MSKFVSALLLFISCLFLCLAGFLWSKPPKAIVEKTICFNNPEATEVRIVWGIEHWKKPDNSFIPQHSFIKDGFVYSRMIPVKPGSFEIKICLPNGIRMDYCFNFSDRTNPGRYTEWQNNKGKNFLLNFNKWSLNPGFSLLISGIFLLIFLFLKQTFNNSQTANHFKIKTSHRHMPMLDGLRGLAVFLVLIHHWLPESHPLNIFPNGALGVNIFFVLSGFLITRILLENRIDAEKNKVSRIKAVFKFMLRRSLRIFPIYYLLIGFLLIYGYEHIREYLVWYITYSVNYLFYANQSYMGFLSHLWSLAVEEQFYLIWPWLILLLPKRFIPYTIFLFILIGISSNFIFNNHGWWSMILTPTCFDSFGIGGIMAYLMIFRSDLISKFSKIMDYLIVFALVVFLLNFFVLFDLPQRPYHSLIGLWLIIQCLRDSPNQFLRTIFGNRFLMFMGKISYGIYLYHLFIPILRAKIGNFLLQNGFSEFTLYKTGILENEFNFMLQWAIVLLIAWVSWNLIENPINRLKNRIT